MTLPDPTIDPSDSSEADWSLIARYLANEMSAEERQTFEREIADDSDQQQRLAELRSLWDQAGSLPSTSLLQAMWGAIACRMNNEQIKPGTLSTDPGSAFADPGSVVPVSESDDELATDGGPSSSSGDRR